MKTFNYTTSRGTRFTVMCSSTVTLWKQLALVDCPISIVARQSASIGFVVVMTPDHNGHLTPRDRVKLIGDGCINVVFPAGSDIEYLRWSDGDMSDWYRYEENLWHRVKRGTR